MFATEGHGRGHDDRHMRTTGAKWYRSRTKSFAVVTGPMVIRESSNKTIL